MNRLNKNTWKSEKEENFHIFSQKLIKMPILCLNYSKHMYNVHVLRNEVLYYNL